MTTVGFVDGMVDPDFTGIRRFRNAGSIDGQVTTRLVRYQGEDVSIPND